MTDKRVDSGEKVVTMHEAKTHLSRLVKEALAGRQVIIARGKVPLIKLVPLESLERERRLGTAKGLIRMREDFEEPIEDFENYV